MKISILGFFEQKREKRGEFAIKFSGNFFQFSTFSIKNRDHILGGKRSFQWETEQILSCFCDGGQLDRWLLRCPGGWLHGSLGYSVVWPVGSDVGFVGVRQIVLSYYHMTFIQNSTCLSYDWPYPWHNTDKTALSIEYSFQSKLEACKARGNHNFPLALNEINNYFLMFL